MRFNTKADKEAIAYRDSMLARYRAAKIEMRVGKQTFSCRAIGKSDFVKAIRMQLREIQRGSENGKKLLEELAKLPLKPDIVEYNVSQTAYYGSIVVMHEAFIPQGQVMGKGQARFENEKGQALLAGFYPYMTLAHELFHVGQFQFGDFFEPYCNWICSWTGGPWNLSKGACERDAVRYTNQIRLDKNLGRVRTYYHGRGGPQIDSYKKALKRNQ